MQEEAPASFVDIKKRLNEIADQVSNTDLPLEEALTLYEEAVNLGLHATNLLEEDITEDELAEAKEESVEESAAPEQSPSVEEASPTSSNASENGLGTTE